MKKTVEEKAELAKLKIDKRLQKQRKKEEKNAAKKEASAAKKELHNQQKAAKKEISSAKKQTKKEISEQKKAAKREAAELKKKAKQEAANKIKALKNDAKQVKTSEKTENAKAAKKEKTKEKPKSKAKGKAKDGEEDEAVVAGGISNKKKLFAGVLALVFVCGGAVGFLHFRGANKEDEKDPYIEAYVLDDDFVTSIPKFLGESEKRELPEITEEQNGSSKRIVYDYTGLKEADEEVRDYINFLTSEKEFVPMFDYNLEAPAGYVSVGTASQEEGKILKLDIDYTESDYRVMVSKTNENLPKPKEKSSDKDVSRDGALNYLEGFSAEKLGLEKPIEEYKTIYDAGQSSIGEHNCYGISLYELGVAGTNVFQGKFFVATNQSVVYRYRPEDDTYVEIEREEKHKVLSNIEAADRAGNTEIAEEEESSEGETNSDEKGEKQSDSKEEESDNKKSDEEEQNDNDKKEKKVQKGRKADRQ